MGFGAVLFAAMDALSDADKKDREAAMVKLGDTIELQISPAGTIIAFGGTSAPTGYSECDGGELSRTGEAVLFGAIGTTWGVGNGSTTFNKPDLRGAFLRGAGSHGTANMANGNDFAGPSVGSTENDQMQGHRHGLVGRNENGDSNLVNNRTLARLTNSYKDATPNTTMNAGSISVPTAGANGTPRTGDETRPFNAGVLYCVKT